MEMIIVRHIKKLSLGGSNYVSKIKRDRAPGK